MNKSANHQQDQSLFSLVPCMNIKEKILNFISNVEVNFQYDKDNLLCFAVSGQPNFLVWSSALALHSEIGAEAKEIALENAREELFGLMNEGSHAPLAISFFKQLGEIEMKHYKKTEREVLEVYKNISNKIALLTFISCIEIWSAQAMNKILQIMKNHGATDFYYIEVHKVADNVSNGHSTQFLQALESENPPLSEIEIGMALFKNLFQKIFD